MSSRAQSHAADAMVGASSVCTLIAGLWFISPEVRSHIGNVIAGDPAGQLSAMASRAVDYGHLLLRVARDYSPDNTPLVGFGIVALVLTFMMFRS
jgi:hypothetical protein